jgi:ABC-type Mn2+/Zn2+ transport system permease subunit
MMLAAVSILPLAALVALAMACALLSVIVVLRGWAFLGEGIAHAGFGGAGTAWLLSLIFPSLLLFRSEAGIYATAVTFSLAVALAVGVVTRRGVVRADAAIGVFLVLSLAWGFMAQGVYMHFNDGKLPPDYYSYLWGRLADLPPSFLLGAAGAAGAVLLLLAALWKETLACCFDPVLAETSGVRAGSLHYLLVVLITIAIVIGMRILGSVLVTALLVLPGTTALLLSRRLWRVLAIAAGVNVGGALAGAAVHAQWRFIPDGPAIVLSLVFIFLVSYAGRGAWGRWNRRCCRKRKSLM